MTDGAYLRQIEYPPHSQSEACVQFLPVLCLEAMHVFPFQEPSLAYCAAEHFTGAYFDCHRSNTNHIILTNGISNFSAKLGSFSGTWLIQ